MKMQKIKEIGSKYIAPAVLAASLYLGAGNAYAKLPVNEETKQAMINKQEREKQNYLERAVDKFSEAIADGKLTRREEKEVYGDLISAGLPNAETSAEIKELYQAIKSPFSDILKQKLTEEGLKVNVGTSIGEFLIYSAACTLSFGLFNVLLRKILEDC